MISLTFAFFSAGDGEIKKKKSNNRHIVYPLLITALEDKFQRIFPNRQSLEDVLTALEYSSDRRKLLRCLNFSTLINDFTSSRSADELKFVYLETKVNHFISNNQGASLAKALASIITGDDQSSEDYQKACIAKMQAFDNAETLPVYQLLLSATKEETAHYEAYAVQVADESINNEKALTELLLWLGIAGLFALSCLFFGLSLIAAPRLMVGVGALIFLTAAFLAIATFVDWISQALCHWESKGDIPQTPVVSHNPLSESVNIKEPRKDNGNYSSMFMPLPKTHPAPANPADSRVHSMKE